MPIKSNRILVFGDVHCPYGDGWAVKRMLREAGGGGYDEIIINGDFLDMESMSRFGKDGGTPTIETELKAAGRILSLLRSAAGRSPITYIQGNHEMRLSSRLNDLLPDLAGLVTIESLLRLDDLGIEYVRSDGRTCHVERQGVLVGHFDRALKGSGKTAVELMRQYGMSVVQGHTHRLAAVSLRTYRGQMMGAESGCLCRLDPRYTDCPDWAHGFVVLERGVPRIVPLMK